jgi:ArsR family transcriptional regulator, arsenate/arsenite/antimonite-responsive transcriptional repressor / arsenate reductase (thioredoxin)
MSDIHTLAMRHAALGDEVRLAIVHELLTSDRTVNQLRDAIEISSPLLAHHLDILENVSLIERRQSQKDRRNRFVVLRHEHLPHISPLKVPADVLFVCTENMARSQLAGALWKSAIGGRVSCAGTHPAPIIHPLTFTTATKNSVTLLNEHPQPLPNRIPARTTVITVCDEAFDELGPDQVDMHWSIPDPVSIGTAAQFQKTFSELVRRIQPYVQPSRKGKV